MKTKKFFMMALAALMVAATPCSPLLAEEAQDSTKNAGTTGVTTGMTVNGKPATPAQKDVAKKMAKQGVKMAKQGVKMAAKAVTDPQEAERLANEMEAMGDEMERLGDSLESLAEDTTFFYEGDEDTDTASLLTDEDIDEIARDFGWNFSFPGLWGGLFGGTLGILGGIFGVLAALFVVVLLFALFTSPIWILILIIWLATRRNRTTTYVNPPLNTASSSTAQNPQDASNPQAAGNPQATINPQATPNAQPAGAQAYVQPYPDENQEIWKSGIMWSCVGVGLILLFFGIGLEDLWGVGALVACIGVAKLVIASTTKKKHTQQPNYNPTNYEVVENAQDDSGSTYQR